MPSVIRTFKKLLALSVAFALLTPLSYAGTPYRAFKALEDAAGEIIQPSSVVVQGAGTVEVAFSPDEGAEQLVIKAIDSSRKTIRMLTYSFTSAPVTRALLRAKKRGVDIAVVVDYKNNVTEDRSGKARAALGALTEAGVMVRTISRFAIHHDKVICIDGVTVETGSFNYSDAAARRNSENVLVAWNNPALTAQYLKHFERNWKQSDAYRAQM